jgi:hypothetical protein
MSVIVSKIEALQLARPSNAALPTVSMKRGLEMLADKKKAVSSRLHNVAEAEAPAAEPQRESIAEADDEAPADSVRLDVPKSPASPPPAWTPRDAA